MNPDPTALATPDLWMTLLKSFAMLLIVLGILLGALYLLKHFFYRQSGRVERGFIKMMASYPVAPKERILLLDVMGERILVGVTPQQISHLATLQPEKGVPMEAPADDPPEGFFNQLLKKRLRGKSAAG